jgi:hypothetical protein
MVGGNPGTDWLALLKKEGRAPREKIARVQGSTSREPGTVKVQRVQKAPTPRKARARQGEITTLTAEEAYEEIANPKTGAGIQARLYRSGEIGREDAVEWITKAILHRQDKSWVGWEQHASATREALRRRERDDD